MISIERIVGKVKTNNLTKKKTQAIIVQYRNWEARSRFYKHRPKIRKEKPADDKTRKNFTVALDLTRRRLSLLNDARDKCLNYPDISYVFNDINCNLVIKMANGDFNYFKNNDALNEILLQLKPIEE